MSRGCYDALSVGKDRISVPIRDEDRAELERKRQRLPGMSESAVTSTLLRYAIWRFADAFHELLSEDDKPH